MAYLNNFHSPVNNFLKFGQKAIHSFETAKNLYNTAKVIAPYVGTAIKTIAPIIRTGIALL